MDQADIEMAFSCKFVVFTPNIVRFPEKLFQRFEISIHSSVHLKNTSEIIRFGRGVVVHEFIESPELEFQEKIVFQELIESRVDKGSEFHVKFEFHERIESPEKDC